MSAVPGGGVLPPNAFQPTSQTTPTAPVAPTQGPTSVQQPPAPPPQPAGDTVELSGARPPSPVEGAAATLEGFRAGVEVELQNASDAANTGAPDQVEPAADRVARLLTPEPQPGETFYGTGQPETPPSVTAAEAVGGGTIFQPVTDRVDTPPPPPPPPAPGPVEATESTGATTGASGQTGPTAPTGPQGPQGAGAPPAPTTEAAPPPPPAEFADFEEALATARSVSSAFQSEPVAAQGAQANVAPQSAFSLL